jgi:hypothetical protein
MVDLAKERGPHHFASDVCNALMRSSGRCGSNRDRLRSRSFARTPLVSSNVGAGTGNQARNRSRIREKIICAGVERSSFVVLPLHRRKYQNRRGYLDCVKLANHCELTSSPGVRSRLRFDFEPYQDRVELSLLSTIENRLDCVGHLNTVTKKHKSPFELRADVLFVVNENERFRRLSVAIALKSIAAGG